MRIHFISIGGSIMHQLALALHRMGHYVTGSDDEIFEPARSNLNSAGLLPEKEGWHVKNITADIDVILLGMHARVDNPELLRAKELDLSIMSFPEFIFDQSKKKKRVVVGGSHGKTTTTSMIMHVLRSNKQEFDFLVGAKLKGFDASVQLTNAPVIVCEGDEYPASAIEKFPKFHFLAPNIAVLTGIAWDHVNVFPTYEDYTKQFSIFLEKIEPGGTLIYCGVDEELVRVVNSCERKDIQRIPYEVPSHTILNGITKVLFDDSEAVLQVFGEHNLLNMNAAFLVCRALGISAANFCASIAEFTGAARRLERIAEWDNCIVFRDFAHAPSKVNATINALRSQFPQRRLLAVLELHTYSSLSKTFLPEYGGSLASADLAAVFYSDHAIELKKLPPINAADIHAGFGREDLIVMHQRVQLQDWLLQQNYADTNLLLMSSGTYDGLDLSFLARSIGGLLGKQ